MKQFDTNEHEIINSLRYLKNRMNYDQHALVDSLTCQDEHCCEREADHAGLPGKHVIGRVMGYARSLEVMKPLAGDPFFLISN